MILARQSWACLLTPPRLTTVDSRTPSGGLGWCRRVVQAARMGVCGAGQRAAARAEQAGRAGRAGPPHPDPTTPYPPAQLPPPHPTSLQALIVLAYFLAYVIYQRRAFRDHAQLPYATYRLSNLYIRVQVSNLYIPVQVEPVHPCGNPKGKLPRCAACLCVCMCGRVGGFGGNTSAKRASGAGKTGEVSVHAAATMF